MAGLSDILRVGAPSSDDLDAPDEAPELSGAGGDGQMPDGDRLAPDPQPSRRGGKRGRRTPRAASGKPSKAEVDQVRDALTVLYSPLAWGVTLKDPHCGGALMEQQEKVVAAMTRIACRNPAMLAFFTSTEKPWWDYVLLAQALAPVGKVVWQHHITHTVGAPDEQGEGVTPVDFSAYRAPAFTG